jgi:hypothetical protein
MILLIYDMEEGGEMSNINSHQKSIDFIPASVKMWRESYEYLKIEI